MNGLLDFLKTPEGQGLLAAGFGYAATANSRTPVQNVGRAGLAGIAGYSNALDNQRQLALSGIQQQKIMQELETAQRTRAARDNLRGTLPQEKQALFDAAPDKYLENLPDFQKAQPGETYDKQGRLVKGVFRGDQFTPIGGAKANLPEGMEINQATGKAEYLPGYLSGRKEIAAAGRSSTNVFTGQKETFKNERDLRNDFAGLGTTKAFNEMQSAYDQINTGLKAANPAGDLAAATKFMKLLDPGSVVRESELAMAMSATGMLDRAQNMAQMIVRGEKLTPKQRQEFGTLSQQLFDASANQYNKTAGDYQSIANDYGLNPERIAKPYKKPEPKQPQSPTTGGSANKPMLGQVVDGYKFTGGNPADQRNWVKQ